jgi:cell division protein FtsB
MIKAVPRGYTTCADAYLTPVIKTYVASFCAGFDSELEHVKISFMQSDGGLASMKHFHGHRAILSGPAGGVVGYARTTRPPGETASSNVPPPAADRTGPRRRRALRRARRVRVVGALTATPGVERMRVRPLPLLLLALAALLAFLQYRLWLGAGGEREVAALREQVARQQAENLRLQQRNEALKAEVEDLKSGEAAVEERARSELGMVRPGETFYRVIEDGNAAPAAMPPPADPTR